MSYIFRTKVNLRDLVDLPVKTKRILVAEEEEYLLALYAYHLICEDFHVKPCRSVDALHGHAEVFKPHLLILNDAFLGSKISIINLVKKLRVTNPELYVVTIGHGTQGNDLSQLMAAGINGHIDRKLSKPQDVAALAKTLLNNI